MTNEKTNPLPYRVAAETGLPEMREPVITPDDVARGTQLLRRYKDGKRALEARIIADEQWYRLRHWQYLRDRRREQGADVVEPTSAWLFNAIVSKHADAMDSFPEAVILPRSEADEPDAKALSAIVPAVLEKTHFEQVWSDAWWYKLKHGCAAYGVFWDSAGSGGLGDVAVRQLDLLNLFWEPGITDIQASRNLFVCALVDNDDIAAAWPEARPGSCGVELAQYLYDDAVDTSNKSIVVDWYYKKPLPGVRTYTCTVCGQTRTEIIPATGSAVCPGGTACPSFRFRDVPAPSNWAHEGIDYCVRHGLMSGFDATTFSPDTVSTRAQIVMILYNLSGDTTDYSKYYVPFTDVRPSTWYYNAVAWGYDKDIVAGMSTTTFAPDGLITREQMAVLLYGYTEKYAPAYLGGAASLNGFPDAASVSNWAYAAMSWAVGNGLISGIASNGADYLAPSGGATRAQIAAIMMRYCRLTGL